MSAVATFSFAPLGQISFVLDNPQLQAGAGSSRLSIPFKTLAGWVDRESKEIIPLFLTGSVWLEPSSVGHRWLAALASQTLSVRGYHVNEELSVSLTDEQVIAIEELRGAHGDVNLRLHLQATWLTPPSGVHPTIAYQTTLSLSRAEWLRQLDQAGYEVGFLVRVPSPLTHSGIDENWAQSATHLPSRAQGAARLRQARRQFEDGDYEQCIATSRKVLENLKQLVKIPTLDQVNGVKPSDRTPDERWAVYFHATFSLTHPAHHDDEVTRVFTWSREDAQAILASVAALLARVR